MLVTLLNTQRIASEHRIYMHFLNIKCISGIWQKIRFWFEAKIARFFVYILWVHIFSRSPHLNVMMRFTACELLVNSHQNAPAFMGHVGPKVKYMHS